MEISFKMTPIKRLVSEAWHIYDNKAWEMIKMAALPYAGMIVIAIAGGILAIFTVLLSNYGVFGGVIKGLLGLLVAIAVVAAVIFSLVATVAMMYFVMNKDKNITITGALKMAKAKTLRFFLLELLALVLVLAWALLFVIPGIVMAFYYCLASWVLIVEDKSGMAALRRSKELVKGYWWAVFGRFLVIMLISIVASQIPLMFIQDNDANKAARETISNIVSLLLTPFMVAYTYAIYKDLVSIKARTAHK